MKILILGESGQVARELIAAGGRRHILTTAGRHRIDPALLNVAEIFDHDQPDVVINAAAYTAVDKAESDVEAASWLNTTMPKAFAAHAARSGVPFVQISTDYVFDGSKPQPYVEDDPLNPLGVYGKTKASGELAVAEANLEHAIVRTAWVYASHGSNFVKTMLRLAKDRNEISVVADQVGCPTWARDVAESCLLLAEGLAERKTECRGVFHAAGAGEASWADLAEAVFVSSERLGGPSAAVNRIPGSDYPTPAARPANSRLSSSRLEIATNWTRRPWRESLDHCMAELKDAAPDSFRSAS